MKMLYCRNCGDIFNLRLQSMRECMCGETGGRYLDDLHAEYYGDYAIPIGFNNSSFVAAIALDGEEDGLQKLGVRFEAFIIPAYAPSMEKLTGDRKAALEDLIYRMIRREEDRDAESEST